MICKEILYFYVKPLQNSFIYFIWHLLGISLTNFIYHEIIYKNNIYCIKSILSFKINLLLVNIRNNNPFDN